MSAGKLRKAILDISAMLALCCSCGCASSRQPAYTAESVIKAQQTQPSATTPAPTATSQTIPSLPIAEPAVEQYYPNESAEHWVATILKRGTQVKLEDGSTWEIASKDQLQTLYWRVADKITVARWPDPQFRYRLANGRTGDTAEARLISPRD